MKLLQTVALSLSFLFATSLTPAQAGDTPDHETWLKKEAREQLRPGMTQDEVKAILGEASRTRVTKGPGGNTGELEYRSSDMKDWMNVFFLHARMTNYSIARMGEDDAESQSGQTWKSPEAWVKVEPGMTLPEVEKLLGKPTAKAYAGGTSFVAGKIGNREAVSAWLYDMSPAGTDHSTGMVIIVNDKVLSITSPLFPVN